MIMETLCTKCHQNVAACLIAACSLFHTLSSAIQLSHQTYERLRHVTDKCTSSLGNHCSQNSVSKHPSVQNAFLSHNVKWSALFLLPSSNNMEQAPCFYLSRFLCHFLHIFPENLPLLKKLFLPPPPPPALRCLCVSSCLCLCVSVGEYVCCFCIWTFVVQTC